MFEAIIMSRLRYALPAWAGFLTKELVGRIDAFLRHMFLFGFCLQCYTFRQIIAKCDETLFYTVTQPAHFLNLLLPPLKNTSMLLRPRGHNLVLPSCNFEFYKLSFIIRCLFNFVK